MARGSLFAILTGQSDQTFAIAGLTFYAAPVTVLDFAVYLGVSADDVTDAQMRPFAKYRKVDKDLVARLEWMAEHLRRRLKPPAEIDPAEITALWVAQKVPQIRLSDLEHVLLHGAMPEGGEKKAP